MLLEITGWPGPRYCRPRPDSIAWPWRAGESRAWRRGDALKDFWLAEAWAGDPLRGKNRSCVRRKGLAWTATLRDARINAARCISAPVIMVTASPLPVDRSSEAISTTSWCRGKLIYQMDGKLLLNEIYRPMASRYGAGLAAFSRPEIALRKPLSASTHRNFPAFLNSTGLPIPERRMITREETAKNQASLPRVPRKG